MSRTFFAIYIVSSMFLTHNYTDGDHLRIKRLEGFETNSHISSVEITSIFEAILDAQNLFSLGLN